MSRKVIITTKRCPCCKYEYQTTKYYKMVAHKKEKVVSRIRNGKPIADNQTILDAHWRYHKFGGITTEQSKKCKIVLVDDQPEEKLEKEVTTKGTEDFKKVIEPSYTDPLDELYGDEEYMPDYLGMFCPNCGVFLDIEKCTTVEEKNL